MAKANQKPTKQNTRQRVQRGSSQRPPRPAIPQRVIAPPPLPPRPVPPQPVVMRDDKYRDVIPKISEEAYQALKASIREHGMLEAVVLDGDGAIADGHSRHKAYLQLQAEGVNVELKTRMENFADEAAARSFIRAVNIARRQLSTKDKRDLIDAELRENPSDSDNAIAKRLGVSDKTVAARRQKLQSGSEFPNPSKRTGRDGKPQSATKRTRRRRQEEPEPVNSGVDPDIEPTALEHGNGMDPEAAKDEATRGENSPTETQDGKNYQATKPIEVQPDTVAAAPVPPPDPKQEAIREAVKTLLLAVYDSLGGEDHFIELLADRKEYHGRDFDRDWFDEQEANPELIEKAHEQISEITDGMFHSQLWTWLGLKEIKAKRQPRSH